MQEWLRQLRPGAEHAKVDDAIAAWLEEFPSLGRSALGRSFAGFRELFPEWQQASVTRLEDFYQSADNQRMAHQFGARLQELAKSWSAK